MEIIEESIIDNILDELISVSKSIDSQMHLNERYLHHYFSYLVQKKGFHISLDSSSILHPEWATYVKKRREEGGLYKALKKGGDYRVMKQCGRGEGKGSSGFLDFALGNPDTPYYAIEFKMDDSIDYDGIIYDYMKLLDHRNPFGSVRSLCVYYHSNKKSKKCDEGTLTKDCLAEAIERLDDCYDKNRKRRFVVLEIQKGKNGKEDQINHYECVDSEIFIKK